MREAEPAGALSYHRTLGTRNQNMTSIRLPSLRNGATIRAAPVGRSGSQTRFFAFGVPLRPPLGSANCVLPCSLSLQL